MNTHCSTRSFGARGFDQSSSSLRSSFQRLFPPPYLPIPDRSPPSTRRSSDLSTEQRQFASSPPYKQRCAENLTVNCWLLMFCKKKNWSQNKHPTLGPFWQLLHFSLRKISSSHSHCSWASHC